jgi:hypothetical protein
MKPSCRFILPLFFFLFAVLAPLSTWTGCINITSPTTGDSWYTTQTYTIRWNTTSTMPTARIYLQTYGSQRVATITSGTPNNGSYSWTIPSDIRSIHEEGNHYYVVICTDDCCFDGEYFSLYSPPPPTPTDFKVSSVTSSSVSLAWGTSTGATGSEVYNCDTNTLVSSDYGTFWLGDQVTNLSPETGAHPLIL